MTHDHPTAPEPEQPSSELSAVPPVSDVQDAIAPADAAELPAAEPDADAPVSAVEQPIAAATDPVVASPADEPDVAGIGAGTPPPAAATPPAAAKPPTSPTSSPAAASRSQALVRLVRQLWGIVLALVPVVVTLVGRLWQLLLVLVKWVRSTWAALLPKLRPILPEPFKTRLPDVAVTATAIILLVLAVWLPTALFSRAPAVEVSERPSPVASPVSPPPPTIDPDKIAAIQTQVAEVSDRYAEGLIQSVEANFRRSRLNVMLGVGWYGLEPAMQDQLANDLLKRSAQLKFAKLDMTDREGTLVARSPAVGSRMVVLQRAASPALQEELDRQAIDSQSIAEPQAEPERESEPLTQAM